MHRVVPKVILYLLCYWSTYFYSEIQAVEITWNSFATNIYYKNVKLMTELEDFFGRRFFSQETPILHSRMECARTCAVNGSCHAFNFYQTESSYVCELLPTNLCLKVIRYAVIEWPGSQFWEKLPSGTSTTCLEIKHPSLANVLCEVMRPGCAGYWPDCSNCTRVCAECHSRYYPPDFHNCTLWPRGDKDWPIFGTCYQQKTYLIKRVFDSTGNLLEAYKMAFFDMNRVYQLQFYSFLEFHFINSTNEHHSSCYTNSYIDIYGTLTNLTYNGSYPEYDMFNLSGVTQPSFPFVNVTDDRYGCGSFWLLDASNATYCPGGQTRLLGSMKRDGGVVISTGISYPTFPASTLITYGSVELS